MKQDIIQESLDFLASQIPDEYGVKFQVTKHFVKRFTSRLEENFSAGLIDLIQALNDNICLIVYFIHLDVMLPDRGRITYKDGKYEIRGNVINDRFVLSTFIIKEEMRS